MIEGIRHSRLSLYGIAVVGLSLAAIPLPARAHVMIIELCTADGETRSLSIPVDREQDQDNCTNPCHACISRKKNLKN